MSTIESLRDQFLLDPGVIFFNHGSFGATPRPVFDSYQRWQRELERQPVEFLGRRKDALLCQAREALGKFLGARAENLVFVTNATVGLNIVAASLHLAPGDEVLATDHEYGAVDRTWVFHARSQGYKYINHPLRVPVSTADDFVENLWEGVTPHTRVISISHITSPTALIFPIREVCRRAREAGILTIIDGAHAPGQIPLDLEALGCDFYTGNLHKWLCAPKGSAFLYARPELHHLIEPLIVSWGWQPDAPSPRPLIDYVEWQGTRDLAAFLAVPDAIQFQQEHDWSSVRARCHRLAASARDCIAEMFQTQPLSPSSTEWFSQMVGAPLPAGIDPVRVQQRLLAEHAIEIPVLAWNDHNLARISVQAYNTQEQVNTLIEALRQVI